MRTRIFGIAPAALGVMLATTFLLPAWAGRSCNAPEPPTTTTIVRALSLAERTYKALDASGAKVVVLARAGQDLSKYGLRYSHLGFAYQVPDDKGGHVWRVLHKLNQCGTADAAIYRQGLGDFFMEDLWRYEAAWIIPTSEVQAKLLPVLQDSARSVQMHHKPYNMVSYPWSTRYQQSNQWAIETLALAMTAQGPSPVNTRAQAQQWLQVTGYQPSTLTINAFTRLGARMTAANIAFDDHPNEKRFSDRIDTVTVDSVFSWMPRSGLTTQAVVTLR